MTLWTACMTARGARRTKTFWPLPRGMAPSRQGLWPAKHAVAAPQLWLGRSAGPEVLPWQGGVLPHHLTPLTRCPPPAPCLLCCLPPQVWDLSAPPAANPLRSFEEHTHEVYSLHWNQVSACGCVGRPLRPCPPAAALDAAGGHCRAAAAVQAAPPAAFALPARALPPRPLHRACPCPAPTRARAGAARLLPVGLLGRHSQAVEPGAPHQVGPRSLSLSSPCCKDNPRPVCGSAPAAGPSSPHLAWPVTFCPSRHPMLRSRPAAACERLRSTRTACMRRSGTPRRPTSSCPPAATAPSRCGWVA